MPFPDESGVVQLVPHRAAWSGEFETLAERLSAALGQLAIGIDHIGSTAVPGLVAKDVIDVQVRVATLDRDALDSCLGSLGFRRRPEQWNNREVSFGTECSKMVFAPPAGERPSNVHVRVDGAPNARMALVIRDYLRANADARSAWGEFKLRLSREAPDLNTYGRIKAPATIILAAAAAAWAQGAQERVEQ